MVAKYRPPVPIYAFTTNERVARQLSVVYGVTPIIADTVESTDKMLALMDRILEQKGFAKKRDQIVFISGQPIGKPGTTNMLKLHRIGEVV